MGFETETDVSLNQTYYSYIMELSDNSSAELKQSQELAINEPATTETDTTTGNEGQEKHHMTRVEILERLTEISASDETVSRDEVSRLKQAFVNERRNELMILQEAHEADPSNSEVPFEAPADTLEPPFMALVELIKEKKARQVAALEEAQRANLARKKEIIDELTSMADDTDNINRHYQRFRELSQEFKDSGEVPATEQTQIWRNYQTAVEHFYDQLKVNMELRDYDFKKNLEQKELIIAESVKLNELDDIITAYQRLQELHDKWRLTGPVARELREDVWNRFKDATQVIYKRYQAYFEERKARELQNETLKTALCERVESLDIQSAQSATAWDRLTKEILAAQNDWKKVGFASKKVNNTLFTRFRKACDDFFAAKAAFFKGLRETHADNLARKTALCEKAESLMENSDWKNTADKISELQKEWKTIGPVERRYSDAIWERFQKACDTFFARRKQNTSDQRRAEHSAFKAKQAIIARLQQMADDTELVRADGIKELRELQNQWQEAGHVPFRDKDKVNEPYRQLVNTLRDKLDINESRAKMASFTSNLESISGDNAKLYHERERTARFLEQKRSEIKTYENNIGFLSISSKSGNSLLRDMENRINRLKDEQRQLEEKLRLIDDKLK